MHESIMIAGSGVELAADLYLPAQTEGAVPAVVTGSGFGGVKEMLLPAFGEALAQAGIATLAVDYAGFGGSGGLPRQDIDPRAQVRDLRCGLDQLCRDRRIDASRLGAFGPSMCGAHALVLAGSDPRVRAAVTIVPFVCAPKTPPSPRLALDLLLDALRRLMFLPSKLIAAAGEPGSHAVMTSDGALRWLESMAANAPAFRNEVTVRSLARVAAYRPLRWLGARGIGVPLRTILSTSDTITPAALAKHELRHLQHDVVEFPGSHFELLDEHLAEVLRLTVEWFVRHLSTSATRELGRAHAAH